MELPIIEVALNQAGLSTELLAQHHHLQVHHSHPTSPHQALQKLCSTFISTQPHFTVASKGLHNVFFNVHCSRWTAIIFGEQNSAFSPETFFKHQLIDGLQYVQCMYNLYIHMNTMLLFL